MIIEITNKAQVVPTAKAIVERQDDWSEAQGIVYINLMNFFAGTGGFVPPFMDHIHSILDLREVLQVGHSNVFGFMSYEEANTLITTHPGFEALR